MSELATRGQSLNDNIKPHNSCIGYVVKKLLDVSEVLVEVLYMYNPTWRMLFS